MRVVHLGYLYGENGTGGAAIAATRLHRALLHAGVDSIFVCFRNHSPGDAHVIEFPKPGTIKRFLLSKCCGVCRHLARHLSPDGAGSPNVIPMGIVKKIRSLKPDVVHVHWILDENGSYEELARLDCPVVVYLHDLQQVNATKPYPFDDNRFATGYTRDNSAWYERFLFRRKWRMANAIHASYVAPSDWAVGQAMRSLMAKGHGVSCVPYAQDSRIVCCPDKRIRSNVFRILFGAFAGRRNSVKGFDELEKALQLLPDDVQTNCEVLVFGEHFADYNIGKVHVGCLGMAESAERLVDFYHAADVFAFPSRAETWGQTKSEAMLCGLPVIAFRRTACAEGIVHGENGWIAENDDVSQFAAGVQFYYQAWKENRICHQKIAAAAERQYSEQSVVDRMLKVYSDALR